MEEAGLVAVSMSIFFQNDSSVLLVLFEEDDASSASPNAREGAVATVMLIA